MNRPGSPSAGASAPASAEPSRPQTECHAREDALGGRLGIARHCRRHERHEPDVEQGEPDAAQWRHDERDDRRRGEPPEQGAQGERERAQTRSRAAPKRLASAANASMIGISTTAPTADISPTTARSAPIAVTWIAMKAMTAPTAVQMTVVPTSSARRPGRPRSRTNPAAEYDVRRTRVVEPDGPWPPRSRHAASPVTKRSGTNSTNRASGDRPETTTPVTIAPPMNDADPNARA